MKLNEGDDCRGAGSADSVVWTLGFTDGDGDFGVLERTADSTTNNLIGTAYEIKNGIFHTEKNG